MSIEANLPPGCTNEDVDPMYSPVVRIERKPEFCSVAKCCARPVAEGMCVVHALDCYVDLAAEAMERGEFNRYYMFMEAIAQLGEEEA